jgi:hypothetical protein
VYPCKKKHARPSSALAPWLPERIGHAAVCQQHIHLVQDAGILEGLCDRIFEAQRHRPVPMPAFVP